MKLATFQTEITPPVGHPLCANWYGAAKGIMDPLFASGVIIDDEGAPIVLCVIEWCEMSNRSHMTWRRKLAKAVGTSQGRVTVHCMHPHCTPWPDEYAQSLLAAQDGVLPIMDSAWCDGALQRVADVAREAMSTLSPVTHLQVGESRVEEIASNRRILGDDGKIKHVRFTATRNPEIRAAPVGLIDPFLKTISFWDEKAKLAALHYYAVHPTSYEDGFVSPDFTGLARARRQAEDGGIPHLYFTECAGNITAGKYNDGDRNNREQFTQRIHKAMVEAEANSKTVSSDDVQWKTAAIHLPPREDMKASELQKVVEDKRQPDVARSRAAIKLAYLERLSTPIEIGALHVGNEVCIVHLPGEAFIEYQLFAQNQRPDAFVAVPAYGDCGPGYICMEKSASEGGYEPTDSFVASRSEAILKDAIAKVVVRD